MTRKEMLQSILDEYNSRRCVQIELVYDNGQRAGIGNKEAISVALEALKSELKRQIEML